MRTYGLLGYPLSHSFSPGYFKNKFEQEDITEAQYLVFEEVDIFDFIQRARQMDDLFGFNVTIPYKEGIMPLLDSISDDASWIGAINTVKKVGNQLLGFNTDEFGFRISLEPLLKPVHRRALILGTGGASKAVKYVFEQLNIPYLMVSRSAKKGQLTYDQINEGILSNYQIIINTTPLGMYPNLEAKPDIPYHNLTPDHLVYDLIYNPEETLFLKEAKAQGATIKNGLEMLHQQAEKSWEIWNQKL